jgi:hypothetical protein
MNLPHSCPGRISSIPRNPCNRCPRLKFEAKIRRPGIDAENPTGKIKSKILAYSFQSLYSRRMENSEPLREFFQLQTAPAGQLDARKIGEA